MRAYIYMHAYGMHTYTHRPINTYYSCMFYTQKRI